MRICLGLGLLDGRQKFVCLLLVASKAPELDTLLVSALHQAELHRIVPYLTHAQKILSVQL